MPQTVRRAQQGMLLVSFTEVKSDGGEIALRRTLPRRVQATSLLRAKPKTWTYRPVTTLAGVESSWSLTESSALWGLFNSTYLRLTHAD